MSCSTVAPLARFIGGKRTAKMVRAITTKPPLMTSSAIPAPRRGSPVLRATIAMIPVAIAGAMTLVPCHTP